jgi:hypothetical protein
MRREPKAILAYLGPIAPSMMKPNVEINNPIANSQGVANSISIERAAMAKQINVNDWDFSLPVKLSSLSASAAAIIPRIKGTISVLSCKYHVGITTPKRVTRIRRL